MAQTDVPKELVVPMDDIAEGVRGLRIAFVNVFAVTHAGGSWTLIDAGIPFSAGAIRSWAEHHFDAPPLAIELLRRAFLPVPPQLHEEQGRAQSEEVEVPQNQSRIAKDEKSSGQLGGLHRSCRRCNRALRPNLVANHPDR